MRPYTRIAPVAVFALVAGCYHQIVQTGRMPGPVVIEKPWTATWLWGLVAAEEINVATQCPSGVATVETQQSFLNGLVAALTIGIYEPREVTVTCASSSSALPGSHTIWVAKGDGAASDYQLRVDAIARAVDLAERTHEPVVVRY